MVGPAKKFRQPSKPRMSPACSTTGFTGAKQIKDITIQQDVVDPDDVEMLQDLIITAVNEAMRQMEEISENEMNKVTGGLGIPGL